MARRRPKLVWVSYKLRSGYDTQTFVLKTLDISFIKWSVLPGYVHAFYVPSKHAYKLTNMRLGIRGFRNSRNKVFKHHVPNKRTLIDWRDL